jgi:hypothetical protein
MEQQAMIDDIRELFQTLLVPQLEGIKGELKTVNTRIDSLDMKVESFRRELTSEIRRVDEKLSAEIRRVEDTLSADFVRIESNVDVRLVSMDQRMESLRRELLAEIKAAR